MAYVPTVWETGDIITAEKLNKAEGGIAAATTIVCQVEFSADHSSATIDTAYSVIKADFLAGKNIIFQAIDTDNGEYNNMLLCAILDGVEDYPNTVSLYGRGSSNFPVLYDFKEDDGVLTYAHAS